MGGATGACSCPTPPTTSTAPAVVGRPFTAYKGGILTANYWLVLPANSQIQGQPSHVGNHADAAPSGIETTIGALHSWLPRIADVGEEVKKLRSEGWPEQSVGGPIVGRLAARIDVERKTP
jgi:hypothetical protein